MFIRFRKKPGFPVEWIVASILLLNSFSWFFIGQIMVDKMTSPFGKTSLEGLSLSLAYPISIIASGIIGAIFLKVRKIRFFYVWLLLGIVASLLSGVPVNSSFFATVVITVFIGISLGLGMPSCLAYFADSTPIEKRGKLGGIIFFFAALSIPLISIVMAELNLMWSAIVLAVWRGWSLLFLFLIPQRSCCEISDRRIPSFNSVFHNKTFLLYFTAWVMFSLVDGFETVVLRSRIDEFRFFMVIIEPAIAGLSALVGGVFSDWVGRKRMVIFGFASLGIAYAILGIGSQVWVGPWIFYFVVDGIAIGFLWVLFTIVLWGDVSQYAHERYYAIGETPLFLTQVASLLLAPYVALFPETSAFSLAAFFLFIAVVPLLYAPETLPEKKIQQRQFKIYTKEALKLRQKTEQK